MLPIASWKKVGGGEKYVHVFAKSGIILGYTFSFLTESYKQFSGNTSFPVYNHTVCECLSCPCVGPTVIVYYLSCPCVGPTVIVYYLQEHLL